NPPNYDQLTTIGRKLAAFNGYDPMGTIWYDVDGATDDWTYGKLGVASYTFEVGTDSGGACSGFFPAYGCIDGIDGMPRDFWAENKPAFLYAHKIARTPYMTAYGPDTDVVTVAPTSTIPLGQVALAATLADHRYDDDPLQPITGAEYFIDVPGEDGAGTPMTVSDGSWGGVAEDVEAMVDVSGLSLGRHLVLVHGQNDDGDWGPFTAAFLDIVDPTSAPVIEGYVREYGTLAPLAGTVVAGAFSTLSDPATGYYSMTVISGAYDMTAIAAGHALTVAGGVEAFHYQTVQQDFVLYPICTLLADDVESGNTGWTADAPWAITDEAAHSPSHSWTDSPGGAYSPTIEVALTSPVLDFTGLADVTLNFWHSYDLESNWDKARIQYSTDGGSNWNNSVYYTGRDHTTWSSETVSLPALDGESNARLRFLLDPDHAMQFDGWHIDDITVAASGPSCPQTTAPVAAFSSNSPVTLGTPVQFTNESTGSLPMAFAWDFGDGAGMSTLSDPIYTYANTGTFTVTLVITNAAGSDDVSHPVIVNAVPVSPTYGVTLSPTTAAESAAPGSAAAYTVTLHNTGTVADTFDLTTSGAEIWTTAVDPTQVTLAAGTLVQITVTVTLPADALGNDVATITATSQGDNAISASATLTTTALPTYRVYLPILQRHE
ncbi:MAG: PKD domain-containing protein, partial [Anaerolineae bacterium]|nr:PKD domain-containing protein [Anaerolineae bacterium]